MCLEPTAQIKVILLLSGGLDSTTLLALANSRGYQVHAITFRYGQRHAVEIDASREIATKYRVKEHLIIDIDLAILGKSALTDIKQNVPKGRSLKQLSSSIPITYVPARNTIFLSYALGYAEVLEATKILIGVNAVDYSGYPDCRPEFIAAFERMALLATKAAIEGKKIAIETPLISMSKGDIIKKGIALGVDYSRTHSCYDPAENIPCGQCDSCRLRKQGFQEANIPDPTIYS